MQPSTASPSVGILRASARLTAGSSCPATLPRNSCAFRGAWSAVTGPYRPITTRLSGGFLPQSPLQYAAYLDRMDGASGRLSNAVFRIEG